MIKYFIFPSSLIYIISYMFFDPNIITYSLNKFLHKIHIYIYVFFFILSHMAKGFLYIVNILGCKLFLFFGTYQNILLCQISTSIQNSYIFLRTYIYCYRLCRWVWVYSGNSYRYRHFEFVTNIF